MKLIEHRRSVDSMKRFYDWFHKYYGGIEKAIGRSLEGVVEKKLAALPGASLKNALEYACGSGSLTLELAKLFKSVRSRDLSKGMLERAKKRAVDAGLTNVTLCEGSMLQPDEPNKSYDYVFISFALHLFSPGDEKRILLALLSIARSAVVIIDHPKKWGLMTAFVEWIEGSYYDRFIRLDFSAIAKEIGAGKFEETEIMDCSVMIFHV